jgi:hypothetical protein
MTLAIEHCEKDVVVVDAVREQRPPFSPEVMVGSACERREARQTIVQVAHLVSRIDACDREIRSLNVSDVRPVLAGASTVIATLLGEVFV